MDTLTFEITMQSIQERVMTLTSTLGRYRSNEAGVHMTDEITLTPGERLQFNDYYEEAVKETYSWVQAFGRDVEGSFTFDKDGVKFVLEKTWHYDKNLTSSILRELRDSIVYWIVYRWLENSKPDEADRFLAKHEYAAQQAQIDMNSETEILQRQYNIDH